jgi:hypothetical protein
VYGEQPGTAPLQKQGCNQYDTSEILSHMRIDILCPGIGG